MSKKQLLIVSGGMEIGGIERSLLGLLGELDYEKYDVDLLLFSVSGEFLPLVDKRCNLLPEISQCAVMAQPIVTALKKQPIIGLNRLIQRYIVSHKYGIDDGSGFEMLSAYWKSCVKFMPEQKKEYDAAISFTWPHEYVAKKVNAKKKIAWIHTDYTVAKMDFEKDSQTWDMFDKIAGVSDEVCAAFKKMYPSISGKKILTIENILSPAFVRAQAEMECAEEIESGCKTILSVGRFCHQKAFELIPQYCRIMLNKGCRFKWYLIGYGGDEELIHNETKKHGVEENLIILGKKTNPYPYMAACDVYAQPSRYEGKAVTVREAQILGKPVLITNFETAPSQVRDGFDGVICEMTPQAVADSIIDLLNDENKRIQLSENCMSGDYSNTSATGIIYGIIEE